MSVFGGNQIRPNIHIQDLINIYKYFISNSNLPGGFYNAGFENLKIIDIAKKVTEIIRTETEEERAQRLKEEYARNKNWGKKG